MGKERAGRRRPLWLGRGWQRGRWRSIRRIMPAGRAEVEVSPELGMARSTATSHAASPVANRVCVVVRCRPLHPSEREHM
jgi:hypothetical protein